MVKGKKQVEEPPEGRITRIGVKFSQQGMNYPLKFCIAIDALDVFMYLNTYDNISLEHDADIRSAQVYLCDLLAGAPLDDEQYMNLATLALWITCKKDPQAVHYAEAGGCLIGVDVTTHPSTENPGDIDSDWKFHVGLYNQTHPMWEDAQPRQ